MADSTTTAYGLTKPEVGASEDTWGAKINTDLDSLDTVVNAIGGKTAAGTLSFADAAKIATTNTGVDVTGVITTDGLITSANINFGDNDRAVFGAGEDLQIFHNGSNSYVRDNGTGILILQGASGVHIQGRNATDMIRATEGSSVDLYFNDAVKLVTSNTGVNITGTVTSEALTLANGADRTITGPLNQSLFINSRGNASGEGTHIQGNAKTRIFLEDTTGDISFYEDTGSTPKLRWKAGTERLGIGTISPGRTLDIQTASGDADARIYANGTGSGDDAVLYLGVAGTTATTRINFGDANDADRGRIIYGHNGDFMSFATAAAEAMRINSAGKVGIANTNPTALLYVGGSGTTLGTTGGNNVNLMTLHVTTSNNDLLEFTSQRLTSGSTFTTAAQRIQRKIDATPMGYMQFGNRDSDLITFGENATEYMRIDGDGKVGIGTSSPRTGLALRGAGQTTAAIADSGNLNAFLRVSDTGNGAGSGGGVIFGTEQSEADGFAGFAAIKGLLVDGTARTIGALAFSTRATNSATALTERMRIISSGNVGIGTTSPSYKLHVSAGAGNGIFVEDDNINGGSPSIKVLGKRTDGNASQAFSGKLLLSGVRGGGKALNGKHLGTLAFGGNHTSGATANVLYPASISGIAEGDFNSATDMPGGLVFYTASAGSVEGGGAAGSMGTEAMRISASGNVGIGTASPNAASALDVQSTTKGVRFPNMTTTQKNAMSDVAGNMVFDTTLGKMCFNTGSSWETITSAT